MSQTENERQPSGSVVAQDGHRQLESLRRHQRRLLYGGGGLLTLLILLAAIGSCLLGIADYHDGQRQIFQDGRTAVNAFLLQRSHGYSASLFANNALWHDRQTYLIQTGEPLAKQFAVQGESLTVQSSESAIPWLVLGHGSGALPSTRLAAYLGVIDEYSSYTSSTIAAIESPSPLVAYGYEPGGSLFAVTGVRDEAQLLDALKVSTREQAFARLVHDTPAQPATSNEVVPARSGQISFYFAYNPVTGEPSLASTMTMAVDGNVYFRRVAFESADRIRDSLKAMSTSEFVVITHDGEVVIDRSQPDTTPAQIEALLRSADLWSLWPSGPVFRRSGGTFLVADRLKGVDWSIVHIYTWRQVLADLWEHLALAATATALILAGLWLLLLRIDRRVLAPALADASRVEAHLRQARHDSEQAKLAAEAASRAKSTFVATMSHEIRTPLNGMLGHLELLSRSKLEAAQRERLGRVRLSADALLGIISDVLDFSRIEAGQLDIDPVPFKLRPLIEQVTLLFAPAAQRNGLKLYFGIDPALASGYIADAHRIRQVLNNLLGNAVKFTESGRISLRASLASAPSDTRTRLRFEVVDSGIGMSEEQLANLFEPFSQADASISRRFGGSGLGLALCHELAQLLGGSIDARSTPGVGSVFTLDVPVGCDPHAAPPDRQLAGKHIALLSGAAEWRTEISAVLESRGADVVVAGQPSDFDAAWLRRADALLIFGAQQAWSGEDERMLVADARHVIRALANGPLLPMLHDDGWHVSCYSSDTLLTAILHGDMTAPVTNDDVTAFEKKRAGSKSRGRVLLVDDHPVNRELILEQLDELGFHADLAEDGEDALRLWKPGFYDAVLTDINMPRMNGYDLTRALRERGETSPILAITAMALSSEKQRCKEADITDLLLKPISLDQLDAAMSRHVPDLARETTQAAPPVRKPSEKVRRAFVESGTHDVQAMRDALSRHDSVAFLDRLHAMKGVLFMLGERDAAQACQAMELRAEANGIDALDETWVSLEKLLNETIGRYAD
ncbi:signal transduction histidine kinase [Luteibacter rhizovicinus]|uniref:histidine kinase n=1 Tax=Luteibacter rhizovicinus TaxID=242606 RepID=A0A4R3YYF6_9GAMM|nr:hybrid sensor histidine kinase/response regulator [Luteibacter rhizovicinus]TCV96393.1 signal transduction histidine kinase [Luteibacter rhizovicinus]